MKPRFGHVSAGSYRRAKRAGGVALLEKILAGALEKKGPRKVKRDAFLYMEGKKDDFAQCSSCFMFVAEKKLCSIFGPDKTVNAGDTCGLYVPGEYDGHKIEARVTPEEADYAANTQVRCEHCNFGGAQCGLYEMLNEALPDAFDLDTKIKSKACCNAWTPA